MCFNLIYENIIDIAKESQIKLGYSFSDFELYYPIESLKRIIGQNLDTSKLIEGIVDISKEHKNTTGIWDVKDIKDGRLSIVMPKEAMKYINENISNDFLKDFIDEIKNPMTNIELIKKVFEKYSSDYTCEIENDSEEYEYAMYFNDDKINKYVYCIHFEFGFVSYHRFLKQEYIARK